MKTFVTVAALAAGANALVSRGDSCCFHLTASGGASGTVGQLSDGQNRIGGGLSAAEYCISDGKITDSSGRGCILTPPTTQFQCDEGASPTTGFSISSEGELEYNGSTKFIACETGDDNERNIYTTDSSALSSCVDITLSADSCSTCASKTTVETATVTVTVTMSAECTTSAAPPPETTSVKTTTASATKPTTTSTLSTTEAPPPETTTTSVAPTTAKTTTAKTTTVETTTSSPKTSTTSSASASCPTDLSGTWEFPHLIIPIDSAKPKDAAGTSYYGTVSSTVSSLFNFDIPSSDSGKTCSLIFLFPEQADLETSSYTFSGNGEINFGLLESPATSSTDYDNAPAIKTDYGVFTVAPGNSYLIATFSCPAGETVGYELKNAGTTDLNYFQDYNPSPGCIVGFWILDSVEPFHQHFSLRNISLQYPYAVHERVPIFLALCISGAAPIAIITVYTLLIDGLFSHHKPQDPVSRKRKLTGPYRWKDRLWELNCGVLGLLLSQALAFIITQVLKNACGKPRPDFIDRCQPLTGSEDQMPYGLSNSTICKQTDQAIMKDGFRSWPSASFAGLFYLSLWLTGKFHVMDKRGETWKTLVVTIPILAATLIAVTRIMDARHHPFDVISGSLLGIACACMSYRQYFPPVTEAWKKGRAYPIRSWATEPLPPAAARYNEYNESTVALHNTEDEHINTPDGVQGSRVPEEGVPSQLGLFHSPPLLHPSEEETPFSSSNAYNRRLRGDDDHWSSSSEDVVDDFEMHHRYTATQNPGAASELPQYEDTTYPAQPQSLPGRSLTTPSANQP
ncbi:hypothetical protein ASPZODRAFT_153460 [Penicilliopsis zonata CBS 506.65]|uniref:Phosphatidic acid phosphatase type 2/haloperoxidase domain-containing protein n=1 Tax=Penicilliopsis zonata CBS 506.65 TaxID=1073090 RepID=A0A1L9SBG6_9EURO|nr:hypothetical protein ASPZODRAFT_153460 [Penicilliopsis zonata CBS 506.65]OJJ44523.1 hypothetical protein ASPZODRAFT_153460 [Penicilliopsis zonata CBS 506.65]